MPHHTTLDSDTTKPSVTVPGDGPADTLDPTEEAVSTPVNPGREAKLVGTVNAVSKVDRPRRSTAAGSGGKDRTETYLATAPDGSEVKVTRNIETGESKTA